MQIITAQERKEMTGEVCPYCGKKPVLVYTRLLYRSGEYDGKSWLCEPCEAWVGCHRGSDVPLGRLANAELREWKVLVHGVFDQLWKSGQYSRTNAYKKLAIKMRIPIERCHIGMFTVEQCKQAYNICLTWQAQNLPDTE